MEATKSQLTPTTVRPRRVIVSVLAGLLIFAAAGWFYHSIIVPGIFLEAWGF